MKVFGSVSAMMLLTLSACADVGDVQTTEEQQPEIQAAPTEEPALVEIDETQEKSSQIEAVPVRVGFDGPDFDACGSYGQVTGLNPQGDNFLSVRSAPTIEAEELDRLPSGAGVSMCDHSDGWVGIVYQAQGIDDPNCGTGSPVDGVTEYNGPCRQGWVSERFVTLVAG